MTSPAQLNASTFCPSHTRALATSRAALRTSQILTTPSYDPLANCVPELCAKTSVAGVAGWGNFTAAAVLVPVVRRSKSVTMRSPEAARAVSGVDGSARARNGFSEAVCESVRGELPELDYTPSCASTEMNEGMCTYDCVRTKAALHVPSSDGRIESATDANGIFPPSSSRKFYGRYTRRMRAQYRRGRLCPSDRLAVFLHLPPLFAFRRRRRDRLERNLIGFRNRRRPQAD
jgi:hypothetical protein